MTKENRKEVKIFLKKYFIAAFLIILTLMLIHYPNVFFKGTTIEYFKYLFEENSYLQLFSFISGIIIYSVIFIPYLIFSKVKYIGWIPLAIFSIFTGLEKYIFYLQGNHTPWNIAFNEDMLRNFMANPTGIQDSLETYGSDIHFISYLFIFPLILFVVLMIIKSRLPKITKKDIYKPIQIIMLGLILATPSFFPLKAYVPYMYRVHDTLYEHLTEKLLMMAGIERTEIHFKNFSDKDRPKNIIFIMDESIRGDLISINNPNEEKVMKTTPYLYSIKDKLINFGNLYSTSNCSYPSNENFFIGAKREDFLRIPKYESIAPTIFQYMQNAGYNTYFVDNVHSGLYLVFKNYDRKYFTGVVNDFKKYQKINSWERDLKTLDEVKEIINNGENNFIFILKYGEHFPYKNAFNKDKVTFKDYGKNSAEEEFNLYMNGLKYSVDDYFKKLLKVVENTDTVVLYQSDHAINITRDNDANRIVLTHCEAGLTYFHEMHSVPGIMYSPNKKWYEGYKNLKHGYSASHMFPTVLDFAGYDEKDYVPFYGHSFKNPETDLDIRNIVGYYHIGDTNTSNAYDNIDEKRRELINPLNKRRVLPNTLPNRHFKIEKE